MWLARKGITVARSLLNEQEMARKGYYCVRKLFSEQEIGVVG